MDLTRRELLAAGAAALAMPSASAAAPESKPSMMGVVIHSYMIRAAREKGRFDDPIAFLEHCPTLGAGGVQNGLGTRITSAASNPAYPRAWAYVAAACALGLLFALCLLSYSPNDPSWNAVGQERTRNLVGPFGAWIAAGRGCDGAGARQAAARRPAAGVGWAAREPFAATRVAQARADTRNGRAGSCSSS